MVKRIYPVISLILLSFILVSWGYKGHYAINTKCPESFPASMTAFRVWADSLNQHGSDADYRKGSDPTEGPKHYLDIENFAEFNTTGRIASTYDSIVSIHGAYFMKSNGTLPWATLNMYDSLKLAFKQARWHKAMLHASDLGHYVGDGHMPLHLTVNYDGRETGQGGIHSRYESEMLDYYLSPITNYGGDSVHFVSNVNKYIFDYIYNSHGYVDSVLAADTYATNLAGNNYSALYYQTLWSKTHFTTRLLHDSSHSLAELIYTAWVEAGSPAFGKQAVLNTLPDTVNKDNVSIYPNPTRGILNMMGDEVFKTEVSNIAGVSMGGFYTQQIDLKDLPNGMYILSIYGKNGFLKKEKVLLAK